MLATKYIKFLIDYAFKHADTELAAISQYLQFSAKQNKETFIIFFRIVKEIGAEGLLVLADQLLTTRLVST